LWQEPVNNILSLAIAIVTQMEKIGTNFSVLILGLMFCLEYP